MDEYIKRSDLIGNFPYNISFCDEGDIYNWINTIPSADVRENVRGKWLQRNNWLNAVCSCCSFEERYPNNFCANCGADMRGENNG